MLTDFKEVIFKYNKLFLCIKILILIVLIIGLLFLPKLLNMDPYSLIYRAISFPIIYSLLNSLGYLIGDPFLNITNDDLTYIPGPKKPRIEEIYKWDEIARFEEYDSLIFSNKIKIILKNPDINYGRKCKIAVHYCNYSRDEIYSILTERLNYFNQNNCK